METQTYQEKVASEINTSIFVEAGVVAPWRAETNQINFAVEQEISGENLSIQTRSETATDHLPQDCVGARVLRIPGNRDVAIFAFGDGVSNITADQTAYRSGQVAEIATRSVLDTFTEQFSGIDGVNLLDKLSELSLPSHDKSTVFALLDQELVSPSLASVIAEVNQANQDWKAGIDTDWPRGYEYFSDHLYPDEIKKLRGGRLPGSSTLVFGLVVPAKTPIAGNTHYVYVFTICGVNDSGRAYTVSNNTYRAINGLYLPQQQFIKPETSATDYVVKATRIPLQSGNKLVLTTDGLDKNIFNQRAAGSPERIAKQLDSGSGDDKTLVVVSIK